MLRQVKLITFVLHVHMKITRYIINKKFRNTIFCIKIFPVNAHWASAFPHPVTFIFIPDIMWSLQIIASYELNMDCSFVGRA